MAKKKTSRKDKGTFLVYKTSCRVHKNKIAKLERHLKAHPNDEATKDALASIKGGEYTGRTAPKRNSSRQRFFKTVTLHDAKTGKPLVGKDTITQDERLTRMGFPSIEVPVVVSGSRMSGRIKSATKWHQQLDSRVNAAVRAAAYERPKNKNAEQAKARKARKALAKKIAG